MATVFLGLGLLWLVWYSKHHPNFNIASGEEFVNYWVAILPLAIGFMWFIGHVFYQPYKVYKEQFGQHAKEIEELNEKHAVEIKELKANNEQLGQTIISWIEKMDALQAKLAERSEADKLVTAKQTAKHSLGNSLMSFQRRLQEAKNISRYEFEDDVRKREWELTNSLFGATEENIGFLLTNAEVALFRDARPAPLPDPEKYDIFTTREQEWQWHVNFIIAKKDELKRIIERIP